MDEAGLGQALEHCAAEVLESMFFTSVLGEAAVDPSSKDGWVVARLSFHGEPAGRFGLRTPPQTARKITANFLGLEEALVTEAQSGEVICELANILCGSVLSRVGKHSRFDLSQPEIVSGAEAGPESPSAYRDFELEEGPLAAWLELRPRE